MTLFKVNNGASLKITNATLNVPHIEPPPPPPDFYILSSSYDTETIFTGSGNAERFGASAKVLATDEGIYSLFGASWDVGEVYLYLSNSSGIETTILTPTDGSGSDHYGYGLSMVSASNGVYIAVAAPGKDLGGLFSRGFVYVYLKDSTGTNLVDTLVGLGSDSQMGSSTSVITWTMGNMGVSMVTGSANNLYVATYDDESRDAVNHEGGIRLFESSSGGISQIDTLTASGDIVSNETLGRGNDMVSSSDGLYIAMGSAGAFDSPATDAGRGMLFHWQSPGNYTSGTLVPDTPLSSSDNFGVCNPSLVSSSEGIYTMMGSSDTDFASSPSAQGRAYLFLSNSSGITEKTALTSSDGVTATQNYGYCLKVLSGSDQPLILFSSAKAQLAPGTSNKPGIVNIYQTSSNIDTWTTLTGSDIGTTQGQFGHGMDAVRYGNSIYIVAGAHVVNSNRGHGYLYKWDLVVSGS